MTGKGRIIAALRRTRRVTGPSRWPSFGQTWRTVSCGTQVEVCRQKCGEDHLGPLFFVFSGRIMADSSVEPKASPVESAHRPHEEALTSSISSAKEDHCDET